MKRNKRNKFIIIILLLLLTVTGCTKVLKDPETKKAITNPVTKQNLTENVLCKPTDKKSLKLYEDYKVDISKLPECEDFKVTSGGYEGLWTSIFVKPLAYLIILIGKNVKSYGLGLIITSILIRLIAYPITKKTAIQSELIKKAKPELDRIEAKYKDAKDQDAMMKKSQETMLVYKKYGVNPLAGCLFAFLQLPLFIAFLEAINRVPAIFESNFLGFQLGTNPSVGLSNGKFIYLILIILVGITTYFSFKMNSKDSPQGTQLQQTNMMMNVFLVMITVMSIFMNSGLGIYWITTNLFTIVQNIIVKRSKVLNEKI